MRGLKRSIPIKKIQSKDSRAVALSRRRSGLYSKACELCLLNGAHMAILTTPCSSNSNASFYSFGHSSVDDVVAAFLSDQRPVGEENLGFWWEEESLARSENVEELRGAIESMSKMLRYLKETRLESLNNYQRDHRGDVTKKNDIKKKDLVAQETQNLDHTLNLQSTSAIFDDLPAISNIKKKDLAAQETQKLDQTLNLQSTSAIFDDLLANSNKIAEEQDQILAVSETTDKPTGNLDQYSNEEIDFNQLIDFDSDSLFDEDYSMDLCSDSQGVEDGALMLHRGLNEEDLLQ